MRSSIFLFAIIRPTNSTLVHSSSKSRATSQFGSRSRCEKSGTTGSTAVRGKPSESRSWRLNSESPSARSQRSAYARSSRHPVGQRERRARCLRSERKVVDQQVVAIARVDELAVVARQRFEAVIRGFD